MHCSKHLDPELSTPKLNILSPENNSWFLAKTMIHISWDTCHSFVLKLPDKYKSLTDRSRDVEFVFAYFPRNSTRHFATSENFDFNTAAGTLWIQIGLSFSVHYCTWDLSNCVPLWLKSLLFCSKAQQVSNRSQCFFTFHCFQRSHLKK